MFKKMKNAVIIVANRPARQPQGAGDPPNLRTVTACPPPSASPLKMQYTQSTVLILFDSSGNISEVKSQRIADSEGPMRFILSFLLSIFTVLVM